MLRITKPRILKKLPLRGDTIVEVLIAIGIGAFAIGTSYAIANRSLQQALTARERNQAVNIIESQIAALKLRFTGDGCTFGAPAGGGCAFMTYDPSNPTQSFIVPATFATPPPAQLPASAFHFCLDAQSAGPTDTSHHWGQLAEPVTFTDASADNISPTNTYNSACIQHSSSIDFFVDISAQVTATSQNDTNRTVYKFAVRWAQAGGRDTNESVVYYRLGASPVAASLPPPVGVTATFNITVLGHPLLTNVPGIKVYADGVLYNTYTYPVVPSLPDRCVGSFYGVTAPLPQGVYSSYYDIDERCDNFTIPLTTPTLPSEIALQFVGDQTSWNTGRAGCANSDVTRDQLCFEDNNIIIHGVNLPGHTISFERYVNGNPAITKEPPTDGTGTLGPYHLWMNWDGQGYAGPDGGTAYFKVI